jgi:hypothetical protein
MELFKKVMNVITTIVPTTVVYVSKPSGAYMITIERTWIGRKKSVTIMCKEAVRTEMSLLDLL